NIEGGLPVEDSVALAIALKELGIDVVDCSAGGMSGSVSLGTSKIRPGYQVDLAAAIRRGAEIPTMAVGAIIEPRQAEAILQDGDADLVALGRQMMGEPHWIYRAAFDLDIGNTHAVLPTYAAYVMAPHF